MIKLMSYTLLLLLLLTAPSQAALIFHQDWEDGRTGSSSEGFFPSPDQQAGDHSLTSSTDRAYSGNRSLKFLVNKGDFDPGERIRCTMNTVPDGSIGGKKILPYDQDRWFGFSVWIRSESNMTSHGIFNFHQQNWGSSQCINSDAPPIGFNILGPGDRWLDSGEYQWRMVSNTAHNGVGEGDLPTGVIWREDASDEMDQWVNFVIHINFSFGDGILEVWKNGEKVLSKPNFTLRDYGTPQSCGDIYPKISAGTTSSYMPILAYQDSHRWGDEDSSYAEVDPAQSGSTPPPEDDPPPTNTSIEAETGKLSGTMEIFMDSSTSGGSYTRIDGSGPGIAEFTVNAEAAGLYNIKGRVYAWSENNDTLLISVDGGQEEEWKLNIDLQKWTSVTYPKTLELSKGTHTIRFSEEDHSARLDYFTIENIQQQLISSPTGFQIVQ